MVFVPKPITTPPPITSKVDWTDGLRSFAAVCAVYTGHITNWVQIWPSVSSAKSAFNALPADMQADLISRAANHGLEGWELMQKVPRILWEDFDALFKWLNLMDISHVVPSSVDPSLANDAQNWTWELRGVNRARGAETMTGAEYREANETAGDLADTPWWEFNDMLRAFMDIATVAGYSVAWLPKSTWKSFMTAFQETWTTMRYKPADGSSAFNMKLEAARKLITRIKAYILRNGNTFVSAFALGLLTFMWPPAQFFMAAWGVTGLLGIFTSILRKACHYGMGNSFVASIAKLFDIGLRKLFEFTSGIRTILERIKDGIFSATKTVVDIVFTSVKKLAEIVQPHVVKAVTNAMTTVKTVAKKAFRAAKTVLTGFINWVGSFFGGPQTAMA